MNEHDTHRPVLPSPGWRDPLEGTEEPELDGVETLTATGDDGDNGDPGGPTDPGGIDQPDEQGDDIHRFGFFPLHRAFTKEWWWAWKPWSLAQLFVWMLLEANYKPAIKPYKGDVVEISVGSLVTSRLAMAERAGVGRDTIARWLRKLVKGGKIELTETSKAGVIIKVCNYKDYTEFPQRKRQRSGDRPGIKPATGSASG